jgi:hypothetical protein
MPWTDGTPKYGKIDVGLVENYELWNWRLQGNVDLIWIFLRQLVHCGRNPSPRSRTFEN